MPVINPEVTTHQLNVNPGFKPVRQKKRSLNLERCEAIAEKVNKLLKVGFIREVHYHAWLANVLMVKNPNGKWRICIDFTDLNKGCPKDIFLYLESTN